MVKGQLVGRQPQQTVPNLLCEPAERCELDFVHVTSNLLRNRYVELAAQILKLLPMQVNLADLLAQLSKVSLFALSLEFFGLTTQVKRLWIVLPDESGEAEQDHFEIVLRQVTPSLLKVYFREFICLRIGTAKELSAGSQLLFASIRDRVHCQSLGNE